MSLSRSGVNLLFVLLSVALALTAGAFLYMNRNQAGVAPAAEVGAAASALPQNHPPVDAAERLAALEKMSAQDPQNPDHLAKVANLYYDLGRYEKAADFYQRSLNLRAKDPNIETDLAVCFHYLGRDDQALETLNNVLAYSPGFAHAMYNKGVILANAKKDIKGAIAVWEDLSRANPEYAQSVELERRIRELKGSAE